jgi:hypothetical protein
MKTTIFTFAAVLVLAGAALAQSAASASKLSAPDIPALLRQVRDHQQTVEEMKEKYTCVETTTARKPDSKGALVDRETMAYEVTFYKGERIRRLVARNGRLLSAGDEAKTAREVEKQIRDIDKKLPELERKRREAKERGEEEDEMGISYLLRSSRFRNPRRESLRGREVIVFEFDPNPDYKPRSSFEKAENRFQVAGAMWIDAADLQVARVEARLLKGLKIGGGLVASLKPGANFVFEQERINNEVWLPTYEEINYAMRAFFVGSTVHTVTRFGDYKRFDVESEKEKIRVPGN